MRRPSPVILAALLAWVAGCAPLQLASQTGRAALLPADLRSEGRVAPEGLGSTRPRLSWSWSASAPERRGLRQTALAVRVASDSGLLARGVADLWRSGKQTSDVAWVDYGGAPLAARQRCHWQVRVWDQDDHPSPWSPVASFSIGLLDQADWQASWIGAPGAGDAQQRLVAQAPWLRRMWRLPAKPRRALAHVASVGYHELHCNGAKVGDAVLAPSVSDLSARARVTTYDLTEQLRAGDNAIGLWLGIGWGANARFAVAHAPLVRAQIEVELEDGRTLSLHTDGTWQAHPSDTAHVGTWQFGSYGGERVDARRSDPAWCTPAAATAGWLPAVVYPCDLALLADDVEPNRCVETLGAQAIEARGPQLHRIDFGRGFTGWHDVTVEGVPGATVLLTTSEREDQDTTYGQRSELVLDGAGHGRFRHRFNYACGRWLTVTGADRVLRAEGHLVRNAYRRTARFACADPLLQRIHDVTCQTFESLTLGGYVVDCAHRERWGYGGDAHATMETALSHYDLRAFYAKWLQDWRLIQDPHGNLPHTCPTYAGGGGPAWSGICVMLPWEIYLRTGDRRVLARNYPTMRRWLAFLDSKAPDDVLEPYHDEAYTAARYSFLGDWVPPGGVQQGGGQRDEDTLFFNNAYRVLNVASVAQIAAVLGLDQDARALAARAAAIRGAVHARFFDAAAGHYASGGQTSLALAWLADLPAGRDALLAQLEHAILQQHDGHLDTGIHGTWLLLRALTAAQRPDLVHRIATRTEYPGWGHMLAQGATTIWEQWDGVHSRLHSSFLSVGAWFVEGLVGIRPSPGRPGYRTFELRPALLPGLAWAEAELDTVSGQIAARWQQQAEHVEIAVRVPPGTQAVLHLPAGAVTEAGQPAAGRAGVSRIERSAAGTQIHLGSGDYRFALSKNRTP